MASIQSKRSKAGQRVFYVVVAENGRRKWLKAGTVAEARNLKRSIESLSVQERVSKLGLSINECKIDDFFQDYVNRVALTTSPNTVKRYKGVLNYFITFLQMFYTNTRYTSQITPQIIEAYQKQRLQSTELKITCEKDNPHCRKNKILPTPQTVNFEVTVLRTALIDAFNHGYISSIPTSRVKRLRVVSKKEARILSLDECQLFLNTASTLAKSNPRMKVCALAFRFILNTGLRAGELCNLTWDDIDLKKKALKVQPKDDWTPKSTSREFFFNDAALEVLDQVSSRQGYVFVNGAGTKFSTDDLRTSLIRVAKSAGLRDLTKVHSLRHTYNSLMQMAGVDIATMGKILGHKDIKTTMIYTHQTQEHLKKSVERVRICPL